MAAYSFIDHKFDVVVVDTLAPSIPGLQTPPSHPAPGDLLDALSAQDLTGSFEVVVVDDASHDDTVARLHSRSPEPRFSLVVVETADALLITTRERSQDVGKVVAELKGSGREELI